MDNQTVVPTSEHQYDNDANIMIDSTNTPFEHIASMLKAGSEAHDVFLRLSQQAHSLANEILTQEVISHKSLVISQKTPDSRLKTKESWLNREQCMEFAIGSIANVLGEKFAPIDQYPTRVRLPDEPLMLVDRIISIEGEVCSMTKGKIVTEHDVTADRWYLDAGCIPTCVAVEAGQADLFLSGYLGVDFETKGLAVYRLLDAVVTFHDSLPAIGKVIHYVVQIVEFFKQADTWLFRFQFEATVDGKPLLTMTEGCAGFFSQAELDAGQGIIKNKLDLRPIAGKLPTDWQYLVAETHNASLTESQVDALRNGDLITAFGQEFANLNIEQPFTIPNNNLMRLVHRVNEIDFTGGRYGIGSIIAEADIYPDDWFLTCHFVDDKVMPGTLMYECCMHTLRIFLLRMGWIAEDGTTICEPIPKVKSRLKCRGQVLDTSKMVTYKCEIKELGYKPEPYAIADALMYVDGKLIVEITDMSLQMLGTNLELLQQNTEGLRLKTKDSGLKTNKDLGIYTYEQITEYCEGKPSLAFGEQYKMFDNERKIARLPRPPYRFLDYVTKVEGEAFKLQAGSSCEAKVKITQDDWYFISNRQADMPFSILLEIGLQPCGWLAAYVGSALASDVDLKFRNLGGTAKLHRPITNEDDVLIMYAKLTKVFKSVGMIIQDFEFAVSSEKHGLIYDGITNFGFFTVDALENQVGLRDAKLAKIETTENSSFKISQEMPFPDKTMRMVDNIDIYLPNGGEHSLGFIKGSIDVEPDFWFFQAHFYQDPVWPGSLGLEAFLQLLKVVAIKRWNLSGKDVQFLTMPLNNVHNWVYRGQVIPSDKKVEVEAVITSVNDNEYELIANGYLSVDGRTIYQMQDFGLRINVQ
jgi:3-hydroxymyristoyl/3-hydroxydecanoyl-(acyl carrier protein) dehydratase